MKRLHVLIYAVALLASSAFLSKAQTVNPCGTDTFDAIEVEKDPSILEQRAKLEAFTKEYIARKTKDDEMIIIPVVFHVVHDYGPENVSLEAIEGVMETINKDYRAQNNEIASVVQEFQDIIGDAKIEFRLAKLDPEGNCTQGVTRTYSLQTYNASNAVKYAVPGWEPSMYLNIWVVNSIPGSTAAWSHYPGISPTLDGIVTAYNYVTSSSHTLSHEIGHYLNLAHPWGSTNEPNLPENCNYDDDVEDTPNTIGAAVGSCNKAQVTCGSLDNVQNHMDYASCEAMFTKGQVDRMRAALNSSVSNRNNLWTEENLVATGTVDGYTEVPCDPIPDFGWDNSSGCQGIQVEFTDNTYNGEVNNWSWEFEGGEPATSQEQNPVVTFANPGEFNVKFTVTGEGGSNSITKENVIEIKDTIAGLTYPFVEGFEAEEVLNLENDQAWIIENEDAQGDGWELTTTGENKVMKANLFLTYNETLSTLISPNINVSNASGFDHFTFKVAYAKRTSNSNDELKVFISKDCGLSWSIRYIKSGNTLVTNGGDLDASFEPTEDQWKEERINLTSFENVNHFMVKFVVESYQGGNLYLDDIKFGDVQASVNAFELYNDVKLFPNPSKGNVKLQIDSKQNDLVEVKVLAVSGAEVLSQSIDLVSGQNTIDLSQVYKAGKGIYVVQIINSQNIHSQKLILY